MDKSLLISQAHSRARVEVPFRKHRIRSAQMSVAGMMTLSMLYMCGSARIGSWTIWDMVLNSIEMPRTIPPDQIAQIYILPGSIQKNLC